MAILSPSPVSSERFTYHADERMLVAEASDLPEFGRVYDDACDVGLTVISASTGRPIVFVVNHVERDQDSDLVWWDLFPADLAVRRELQIKVRVFND